MNTNFSRKILIYLFVGEMNFGKIFWINLKNNIGETSVTMGCYFF